MSQAPGPTSERLATPAIRAQHLWHRYGALDVLRDVSFEVNQGEIFGFIGPNGAGKTTTIRIMATLLEPTAGRVEIDGIDVTVDPDRVRRIIGYMPDHAGVYERITVREFLEFFADAYRVPELGVVDAVIELTELSKLEDRLVVTLSKGMKQRLQIARILLHDPKVLVLDEPASDLDPRARIEVRDLLLELRDLGKTIFLSSHILTELSDVCTSVGILERGELVVAGTHRGNRRTPGRRETPERRAGLVPRPRHRRGAARHGRRRADPGGDAQTAEAARARRIAAGRPDARRRRRRSSTWRPVRAVSCVVQYVGGDAYVAEVVRYLVTNGVGIVSIEPERNELERIFLEVTRGELQ